MASTSAETTRAYYRSYDANRREAKREYARAYREQNREKINAKLREHHEKNREKRKEKSRLYREKNREIIAARKRLAAYGISQEQFDALNASGVCHICGDPLTTPHVDHCHTTGLVRGILCNNCNTGIGMFRDNPELLRAAIDYLQRNGERN